MRLPAFAAASVLLGACGLGIGGLGTADDPETDPAETGARDADAPEEVGAVDGGRDAASAADASALDASAVDAASDGGGDAAADVDAGGGADGGGPSDAALDGAGPDAGCTALLDEEFTTAPTGPDWATAGGSLPGWRAQNGGEVGLIAANEGARARALWYTRPLTFDGTLCATVEFAVEDASPDGTGISLVWGAAPDFDVGGQAMGLGICGAGIVGVAAQYRYENGRVDSISSTEGSCGTGAPFPTAPRAAVNLLTLELAGSSVTARFNATSDSPLTGTFARTGYIGVTASTDATRQSGTVIRSLRVLSCPP